MIDGNVLAVVKEIPTDLISEYRAYLLLCKSFENLTGQRLVLKINNQHKEKSIELKDADLDVNLIESEEFTQEVLKKIF